ncbi:MAG: universal stress protein [Halobacteriales archaeon]
MTFLVPFDGSALSRAALERARAYATAVNDAPDWVRETLQLDGPAEVVAVSVIPESARYAREKGWLDDTEPFDRRAVAAGLRDQVLGVDPAATFEFEFADAAANAGTISKRLRQLAEADHVSVVFIGSEHAGRIITPVTSVGGGVAASRSYDVHIVRRELADG